MRQRTYPHHWKARQPLAKNWMIENRIMLVATSTKTSRTPSSTIPPAMPNTPERNELKMMVAPIRAMTGKDIAAKCLAYFQPRLYPSLIMAEARAAPLRLTDSAANSVHLSPLAGEVGVEGAG